MIIPSGVWRAWGAPPIELALILLPALWYSLGVRAVWRSAGVGRGVARSRVAAFAAAILVLLLALASPLDAMSDELFSAHMVQHLLLILVAAPLFVAGTPLLPAVWALPRSWRPVVATSWHEATFLRAITHAATTPAAAFVLHFGALWFWHMPAPYEAALRSPLLHALEHLSFLGTAVLFWWTVATPTGRPRASEATGIFMIVGTLAHSGALGALLMFAQTPWHPSHAAGASAWGLRAIEDQQLAGLIMWIPAGAIYVATAAALFIKWMHRDERRLARPLILQPHSRALGLEELS